MADSLAFFRQAVMPSLQRLSHQRYHYQMSLFILI